MYTSDKKNNQKKKNIHGMNLDWKKISINYSALTDKWWPMPTYRLSYVLLDLANELKIGLKAYDTHRSAIPFDMFIMRWY